MNNTDNLVDYKIDYIPISKLIEAGKYYDLSFNKFLIDVDSLKIDIGYDTLLIENQHYKIDKNGLLYIYSIKEQEENKCEIIIQKHLVDIIFKIKNYN
jgi:hypothetical protein